MSNEPLKPQPSTLTIKGGETKAPRGEGHTITIDLKEHPELLSDIKAAAKADDREPSKLLRKIVVALHAKGQLIPKA